MSVDISKLKRGKYFENEKIKILFPIGQISDSLSVYIKDEYGENHPILWKYFENEKIKILFSIGQISDSLSVYIKDEYGENHPILWELSPDRNQQNFDKANEKIRAFVQDKINEWVNEEEEADRLREESIQNRKTMEENKLRKLMDSF